MEKFNGTVTIDVNEYNTLVEENKSLKEAIDKFIYNERSITSMSYGYNFKQYHLGLRVYDSQDQKEEVLKLEGKIKALEKDLADVFFIENKFIIKLLRFFSKK